MKKSGQYLEVMSSVVDIMHQHIQDTDKKPTLNLIPLSRLREKFQLKKVGDIAEFQELVKSYLEHTTFIQNPNYIGHQVSDPSVGSTAADLIQGTINNSSAVYDMGSAGVAVEWEVLDWMNTKIGYNTKTAGGVLTHGGSIANLTAFLAARSRVHKNVWQEGNDPLLVALVPDVSHYCVSRSVSIMGLGAKNIIKMKTDAHGKVIVSEMQKTIDEARAKGLKPFIIVGNACSTAIGSYDDLEAFANIAEKNKIWFHVDGAHGASALLSKKHSALLKGIHRADSVVWDAHKMLLCSSLCAATLFKNKESMEMVFQQDASYLSEESRSEHFYFYPYTVECTKPPIGLKFYLTYALLGEEGLRENIESLHEVTQQAYELVQASPHFDSPMRPESNILLFKLKSSSLSMSEIHKRVLQNGKYHITYAKFKETSYLRLTVINSETEISHIQALFDYILSLK